MKIKPPSEKHPSAIFLDKTSVYPQDLDFSALQAVADWQWFDNANPGDIQHGLEAVEILVSNKIMLSEQVLSYCKQLKMICIAATGVNNVDLVTARKRGITICNIQAYATASVVQHVFSMILALNRKLFSYQRSAGNGDWSHSDFFCYFGASISELEGKTIGIIGYGELGRAVAKIAPVFGMKVLLAHRHRASKKANSADEKPARVDLKTLLSASDVVSLHCPLTENNYHMIGEAELQIMKPDAILINTARGGLVDETALLNALRQNQIAAAALDVLEQEPPSVNHKLLAYASDNCSPDNLLITPHIAWAGRASRQCLIDEIAQNILAFRQGIPRNIV